MVTFTLSPERLHAARKAAGLTADEAARQSGLKLRNVYRLESEGEGKTAYAETVAALAATYGVTMESLFVHADEPTPPGETTAGHAKAGPAGGNQHGTGPDKGETYHVHTERRRSSDRRLKSRAD